MSEKTPVSVLQEFCMQQKVAPPTYDINETKTKEFVCVVSAFNNCAEATARSKIEAKQASCTSLLRKCTGLRPNRPKQLQFTIVGAKRFYFCIFQSY